MTLGLLLQNIIALHKKFEEKKLFIKAGCCFNLIKSLIVSKCKKSKKKL